MSGAYFSRICFRISCLAELRRIWHSSSPLRAILRGNSGPGRFPLDCVAAKMLDGGLYSLGYI